MAFIVITTGISVSIGVLRFFFRCTVRRQGAIRIIREEVITVVNSITVRVNERGPGRIIREGIIPVIDTITIRVYKSVPGRVIRIKILFIGYTVTVTVGKLGYFVLINNNIFLLDVIGRVDLDIHVCAG